MYKTIDLCAGIGGIRRGFELTGGFENVLSAEINKFACQTYKHLYGDDPYNDLTTDEFREKVKQTEYDVLLAGFPCQSFSRQGNELGFGDKTRGNIFYNIAKIIEQTRPKAIFLENVDNLVRHDKGHTIFTIINIMLGQWLDYKVIGVTKNEDGSYSYDPKSFIRNSMDFGLPQRRRRAYIMAFDRRRYGNTADLLPNELPKGNDKIIYKDLNDILEMGAPDRYYLSSKYYQTLIDHKARNHSKGNGFGYKVVNAPGIEHPIANTILATGGSGRERNLVYDPQKGIPGKIVPNKKTPLNNDCIRTMTPREWGKLQGFIGYAFMKDGEEGFSFPDGMSNINKYQQFGNSVTIPVIETMAKFMLDCFTILNDK